MAGNQIISCFKAIIMGIIEGITEFLPISSTGHMIIAERFIKLSENRSFTVAFEVIIQLGAILSVILFFWHQLWPFSGISDEKRDKWLLWSKVAVGVLPAVVIGYFLDTFIEQKLFNPLTVMITLIFYGIVILIIEWRHKHKGMFAINDLSRLGYAQALFIGFFQCLAMVPGTSRSAATIIGGLLLGLNRPTAAEFSFFLAIPTMAGASLLKGLKTGFHLTALEWGMIGIGFLISFLVALAVIKFFMDYIRRKDFRVFGYYRILLGAALLILIILNIL